MAWSVRVRVRVHACPRLRVCALTLSNHNLDRSLVHNAARRREVVWEGARSRHT